MGSRSPSPLPGSSWRWLTVGLAAGVGALLAIAAVSSQLAGYRDALARRAALEEAQQAAAAATQVLMGSIQTARTMAVAIGGQLRAEHASPNGPGSRSVVLAAGAEVGLRVELSIRPGGTPDHPRIQPVPASPPALRLVVEERLPPADGGAGELIATVTRPLSLPPVEGRSGSIGILGAVPGEVIPLAGLPPGRPWPFGEPGGTGPGRGRRLLPASGNVAPTALAWMPVDGTPFTMLAAVPLPPLSEGAFLPWLAAALGAASGAMLAAMLRGAAERRRLESALARAQRDHDAAIRTLADRQGLETLGRLTAGVAHEMGNVIQAVEFYLRAMPDSLDDKPALAHLIDRARGAARRGAAGARDLLALARGSARRPEPTEIGPLLTEIADVMQELLGETFTVRLDLAPTLPAVLTDAEDLEAMLVNLATNSRDAMAAAGSGVLSISAALVGSPDAERVPDDVPGGEWVRVDITDTGVGMDAETLARAMEPFFTTKPRGRGTGLGLALAREFAERCGGLLRIESAVGSGTRASLFLHPASETKVTPDADSHGQGTDRAGPQSGALSSGHIEERS